jgi:cytochrome P450
VATAEVIFNPFEPGFTDDPYPQWKALRENDPVHHTPFGMWLLLRYDDVQRFVRDPSVSVEDRHGKPSPMQEALREQLGELPDREGHSMLGLDPPDHTRLRRLVSKAFTPRVIETLRPRLVELVDQTLDAAEERGEMELVGELAFPLPFQVISEMLGMPEADSAQLREWSGTIVRGLEPNFDVDVIRAIMAASVAMEEFLGGVIEWKRAHPADDLLTALIAAEEQGDVLSDEELRDQVALLYIAGHETTVNLIGNGTLALLRHRHQLERLQREPELIANCVDELLRFEPPVQFTRRITRADVEIDGRTIEKGSFVACVIGSANRDPAHWGETADDLDIGRQGASGHVAFGGGAHYCLGAALARLEGQVAIGSLVSRFPDMELAGEPVWNGRINLRGVDRLPLTLGR